MSTQLKNIFIALVVITLISCNTKNKEKSDSGSVAVKVITTEKELEELNNNIVSEPNNSALYHQRAKYYISTKDFNAALLDMSRVMTLDSSKAEYLLTLSDLYYFTNRTGTSKYYLEKIVQLEPKNTEALLKLAEIFLYVKKYQEAFDNVNKALQVDVKLARGYYIKGKCYEEIGDTAKAISSLITATEQNPDFYAAFVDLGFLNAAQKNKAAIGFYDQALRINPNSIEALYNKGKFYQDMEQYDDAINTYNTLLKVDSANSPALYGIGAINFVKEDYKTAVEYFSKTIHFNPKYVETYYSRGISYKNLNDKQKAVEDLKMALQLYPEYTAAKEALSKLK